MADEKYYVVGKDGNKFGPASLDLLIKWAEEGRVRPETILERATDGVQGAASYLPGLVFAQEQTAAAPPVEAPPPSMAAQLGGVQFKASETPRATPSAAVPPPYSPPGYAAYPGYPRAEQYRPGVLPLELTRRFNWGAFLLTWIWGLNHKAYITLISCALEIVGMVINGFALSAAGAGSAGASGGAAGFGQGFGVLGLALAIFYGARGYEWAWQSGRFSTPEDCRRCQATWGWWGLAVKLLTCGILLASFAVLLSRAERQRQVPIMQPPDFGPRFRPPPPPNFPRFR